MQMFFPQCLIIIEKPLQTEQIWNLEAANRLARSSLDLLFSSFAYEPD